MGGHPKDGTILFKKSTPNFHYFIFELFNSVIINIVKIIKQCMLEVGDKSKINAYIFFGLFLATEFYFGSYENMREYIYTGALILGIL